MQLVNSRPIYRLTGHIFAASRTLAAFKESASRERSAVGGCSVITFCAPTTSAIDRRQLDQTWAYLPNRRCLCVGHFRANMILSLSVHVQI